MRLRSRITTLLVIAITASVVFLGVSKSAAPVTVSVVNVTEMEDPKRVTMEFLRHDEAARFAEAHQLQIRVGGEWQPPLSLPKFEDGYLLARTNSQQLVLDFPRQTEACRFLLGYRVGPRPYCQVYFFLSRHGVSQKFPALSKAILKCVPQQPRLRRFECELASRHPFAPRRLPREARNNSGALRSVLRRGFFRARFARRPVCGPPCNEARVSGE